MPKHRRMGFFRFPSSLDPSQNRDRDGSLSGFRVSFLHSNPLGGSSTDGLEFLAKRICRRLEMRYDLLRRLPGVSRSAVLLVPSAQLWGVRPPMQWPAGGEGHLHDATLVNTIKVMVPNQVVVGGIVTVGPQRCVFWGAGFPGNESRCFEVRTLPTQNKNRKPKPREFCPCPPECSPQILEI